MQKLIEILRAFPLGRTKDGALVSLSPSEKMLSVKSKAFIEKVRKAYFTHHHDGVSPGTLGEALTYLDSNVPETDATPAQEAPTNHGDLAPIVVAAPPPFTHEAEDRVGASEGAVPRLRSLFSVRDAAP